MAISLPRTLIVAVAIACIIFASTAVAKTIYVDDDATGLNNGTSWANAYTFLQDGLADANSADKPLEIRVAQGTYRPDQGADQTPGDREASFQLVSGVTIKGGYAGLGAPDPNARDIAQYETILSGDLAADDHNFSDPADLRFDSSRSENSHHVVTASSVNRTAQLDGFAITAGNANGLGQHQRGSGGGMYTYRGAPTVENCAFRWNSANWDGGGMANNHGSPAILACTFHSNSADAGGGVGNRENSSSLLAGCVFEGNSAAYGAAIWNYQSAASCAHCLVIGNHGWWGGGMFNEQSSVTVSDCWFTRNIAGSGGNGGAMNNAFSTVTIVNSTFSANRANDWGGAIHSVARNETRLANCTFARNSARRANALAYGSVEWGMPSQAQIVSCIMWDGGEEIVNIDDSVIDVRYSNVQGGWPGETNIDQDPLFVNPGHWDPNNTPDDPDDDFWVEGDYHLKSQAGRWDPVRESWVKDDVTSPSIDAGDPLSPIGHEPFPNGGRINIGAYGGSAEASKSYFGEPLCETIVAGDVNGDCKVDWTDLAIAMLHWLEDRRP